MGSIVAIGAVLTARHRWRGVITSSNSLEVFRRGPNPLNPFFRLASRVLPHIRVPLGLDARKISTDEAVQHAYANDPLDSADGEPALDRGIRGGVRAVPQRRARS